MSHWLTWQIVDSAFPTGLFAHSWGLESAWQHGEVSDTATLRAFLESSLLQTGYATLPFVNAVYASPDQLEAADARAEAFLTNTVANRASRVQGRTLAATAARVWPSAALDRLEARARRLHGHAAPIAGATFHHMGLPLSVVQAAILFGTARGVLSAAVRLGIVGTYEAQRVQHACAASLETIAQRCAGLSLDEVAQASPVMDLLQAGHDRLYSRLFQS